jgi:UDP-N-acetylmuramoyl-tripeptide--D-alanyl-D-alanine ligase
MRAKMLTLKKCAEIVSAKSINVSDLTFSGISTDPDAIKPGELYVAINRQDFYGNNSAKQAVKNGAVAVLVRALVNVPVPQMVVVNTAKALEQLTLWYSEQSNQ